MAIPRNLIRKMAADNTVYMQGLSLAAQSFSHAIHPTRFTGVFEVKAKFKEDKCQTMLEIDNENEWIESMDCSCRDFPDETHPCKHITALLIKVENDFFSNDFARNGNHDLQNIETDSFCKDLLSRRAKIIKARAFQRAAGSKAMLLPQLTFGESEVYLGLKAGCERAYVVKNLNEFYELIHRREVAPCGRAEAFLYAPENFQDREFVDFFMDYYPLCSEEGKESKIMELTPSALDRFMQIFAERKLGVGESMLTITADVPAFTLYIKASNGFYRCNLDHSDFSVYEGNAQIYLKEKDTIYACGAAFSDVCTDLLRRFIGKKSSPVISAEDMRSFYSMIVKPASRFIRIEADSRDFMPPALKTKIYMDVKGNAITAKVEFVYADATYPAFAKDRDLQTVWDIEGEAQIENLIRTYFPDRNSEPGTVQLAKTDENLFQLMHEAIPTLSRHAVLYVSATLQNVKIKPFPQPTVGVKIESNLLKMNIEGNELPPSVIAAALAAYRQKQKFIRLKNGSFLLLETDSMEHFNAVMEGVGVTPAELKKTEVVLPAYRALYLDSVTDIRVVKDKSFTELAKAFTSIDSVPSALPAELEGVLRDYQKYGFRWLSTLTRCGFGGILADDMGLGKTVQILALLAAFKQEHGSLKALVVCPASLVLNWECEVRRFTPSLRTGCMIGSTAERMQLLSAAADYDVMITSYDLLKRDIANYQALQFDFEIIDEAQYIKNHNTQNARAVKSVQSTTRFALTGTPIENTIAELWSIFDFLMPGYLYKYARFRQRFEVPVVKDGDMSALKELKRLTAPFILRRLKRDVLKELPAKTETVLYAKLAEEQNKLYAANLASMRKELEMQPELNASGKNRIMILAMLTRLRQICCDPALLYENYREESAKFDLCMNLVESSVQSGHKMLIFSQFTSMLSLLEKALRQRQIPYYLIEGSTKKEDRLAQVSAFNQDDTPVFLISLKAGGTGLNLTGADIVIHYDPWWNLSAQNQATDRAHRIGQKNSVSVYKLIAKGTIEEKILALAEKKQSLAENVLPDETTMLRNMTREQILDLFKP